MAGKRVRRRRAAAHSERETRLRVIGGEWRSRVLTVANRPGLRPTPDRVRETLFNWLAPRLAGAHCIDLFAGTGALGIEALSRGAASTVFIESDRQAATAIEAALDTLDARETARVIVADGRRAAEVLDDRPADVVFIDPPFEARLHDAALAGVRDLIDARSRIYLEYPAANEAALTERLAAEYEVLRRSKAGGVGYCLARIRPTGEHGLS